MGTIKSPRPTSSRSLRRWVFAFLLIVLPIALVLFVYLSTRFLGGMRLDEAIAEADRLDPGWRFAELEASRGPFPEPLKNGMDHILRVKAAMPKGIWPEWPFSKFNDDQPYLFDLRHAMNESLGDTDREASAMLNTEQERVLRAEAARAREAIELARQMPNYPSGRYVIKWTSDFIDITVPQVQESRKIGDLMRVDGRLRAHDGDIDGALQDAKAILYADRAVGDEHLLWAQLVRMISDLVAIQLLERVLACGQASEKTLSDVQTELEKQSRTPFFLLGIRGERAGLDYMLQNADTGEIPAARFHRILQETASISSASRPTDKRWLLEFETWRFYLNLRNERAQLLHFLDKIVELAKEPSWQGSHDIPAAVEEEKNQSRLWSNWVYNIDKSYILSVRLAALLRTAYTALAVERFRLAKGHWPTNLTELVPQFLDAVPLDPFDGKPLRYVRKGETQIIYSVSKDREDQGGTFLNDPTATGSDVGFILQDLLRRRLPGKPFVFPPRQPGDVGPVVNPR